GIYGWNPRLVAQLELELESGEKQLIASDASWRCWADGPIRSNDILDGETYDASKETPGWVEAGFDDGDWRPVRVADDVPCKLSAQPNEPIRVIAELQPVGLSEPNPG